MVSSHLAFRADDSALGALASKLASGRNGWNAVHILASECPCSRAVADYLIRRGSVSNLHEAVVLIGENPRLEKGLRQAGFPVQRVSPEEVAERFHVEGAPWLVFMEPGGAVRYAGGYAAERNARGGYRDMQIWKALEAGQTVASLPAFGCAIGQRLQRAIDPLGLKYKLLLGGWNGNKF